MLTGVYEGRMREINYLEVPRKTWTEEVAERRDLIRKRLRREMRQDRGRWSEVWTRRSKALLKCATTLHPLRLKGIETKEVMILNFQI